MITQEELKHKLNYDTSTGVFTWAVNPSKNRYKGEVAGSLDIVGYIRLGINKRYYWAHRLAWLYVYGYMPKVIDHINHIKNDNRICNLRECTHSQNRFNTGLKSTNTSGIKGVSWNKARNKWVAQATLNYKARGLGYFDNVEDAKNAYDNFCKKHHGEFFIKHSDNIAIKAELPTRT